MTKFLVGILCLLWAVSARSNVVEFHNTVLDHYFVTANASEQAAIDAGSAGPGWERTGGAFLSGGPTQVCRFYGSPNIGPNSHFYTADPAECGSLKQIEKNTPSPPLQRWNFESLEFTTTPAVNRSCASGFVPVYRAYNNGFARGIDSNHRITSSKAAIAELVAKGWIDEGIVMCAPSDVLSYTDKVYVTHVGGYPYSVTKSGVTKVKNMTEFTFGFYPLYNCSLYETPIDRGIIPVSCYAAVDYGLRIFYIDPITNELYRYSGDYVFDASKWHSASWGSWNNVPYLSQDIGPAGSYAEVVDGIYYFPNHEGWTLKFSDRSFTTSTVLATDVVGGEPFRVIIGYSNP